MTEQREPTRDELKVISLTESIRELTGNYENKVADLRIELTQMGNAVNFLQGENQRLQQELDEAKADEEEHVEVDTGEEFPEDPSE